MGSEAERWVGGVFVRNPDDVEVKIHLEIENPSEVGRNDEVVVGVSAGVRDPHDIIGDHFFTE